jgi:hypothetical protein
MSSAPCDVRVPCKCASGSVLANDLDATSGGGWLCPWCDAWIDEATVREALAADDARKAVESVSLCTITRKPCAWTGDTETPARLGEFCRDCLRYFGDDDPRAIEGVPMREQQAPRIPDLCPDETRDE